LSATAEQSITAVTWLIKTKQLTQSANYRSDI